MNKRLRRSKRHRKIRSKIAGTLFRPRLSVFRSNRYIYAQLIDDISGKVLVCAGEKELEKRGKKTENAYALGILLAQKAKAKKIKNTVFDRGGYAYHGRVKNLAEGARKGGLVFQWIEKNKNL